MFRSWESFRQRIGVDFWGWNPFTREGVEDKTWASQNFSVQNVHKTLRLFRGRNLFWGRGGGRRGCSRSLQPPNFFEKGWSTEFEIGSTFQHKKSTNLCAHFGVEIHFGRAVPGSFTPIFSKRVGAQNSILTALFQHRTVTKLCVHSGIKI